VWSELCYPDEVCSAFLQKEKKYNFVNLQLSMQKTRLMMKRGRQREAIKHKLETMHAKTEISETCVSHKAKSNSRVNQPGKHD
jgi:hypothetical protein